MSVSQELPVATATARDSIWRDVDQGRFRKRVDDLHRKNDVPDLPKTYDCHAWQRKNDPGRTGARLLPLEIEERIANDTAFIAAARKDVKTVSAVAFEEVHAGSGLVVRLAANGAIEQPVIDTLVTIVTLLQDCATKRISRERCKDEVFDRVVHLHRKRLHARLQSKHFKPPKGYDKHPKPLSQDLEVLARHATFKKKILKQRLAALAAVYQRVDDCNEDTQEELLVLKNLARQSYDFCTPEGRTIEKTVASYGLTGRQALENKHIRQMNKIGRYYGLSVDMSEVARKYHSLFGSIKLYQVPRYQDFDAPIANALRKIPCHVHAEIRLSIFYLLRSDFNTWDPRVLGVSKSACYLCNLFILNHNRFFITKTHGRLYPLWNVPDLAEYNPNQRLEIRRVLGAMNSEVITALDKAPKQHRWPIESFVHLPARYLSSPATSDLATLRSKASQASETILPSSVRSQQGITGADPLSDPRLHGPSLVPTQDALRAHSIASTTSSDPSSAPSGTPSLITENIQSPSSSTLKASEISDEDEVSEPPKHHSVLDHTAIRTVTASAPGLIELEDCTIFFEIEGVREGECRIVKASDSGSSQAVNMVDVRAMKLGEEREFSKNPEEDSMVLNLQFSQEQLTRLTLRW